MRIIIGKSNQAICYKKKKLAHVQLSATIYNMVEIAKANDLVIEKYLVYLMEILSNLEVKNRNILIKHMP